MIAFATAFVFTTETQAQNEQNSAWFKYVTTTVDTVNLAPGLSRKTVTITNHGPNGLKVWLDSTSSSKSRDQGRFFYVANGKTLTITTTVTRIYRQADADSARSQIIVGSGIELGYQDTGEEFNSFAGLHQSSEVTGMRRERYTMRHIWNRKELLA